ncbi:MAG: hypothetical protein IJE45_03485 [Bacilli bacterium]|nr:hypothetical protein [Bacilli bacterium]
MIILSYNPDEDELFIGLSFKEFEKINKDYDNITYCHWNYQNDVEHFDYQLQNKEYVKMIKQVYGIDELPYICIITDRKHNRIQTAVHHHPFHQLYNGYSPWKKIKPVIINSFDLENIMINTEANY